MSAKKQEFKPFTAEAASMEQKVNSAIVPSVRAKVVSHSRDYLTLEFIGTEPKAFMAGEVVSVSKE